jgi:muramidase (phage lysozyme)
MAAISAVDAGGEALVKFLDLIAFSEGTSTSSHTHGNGYDVIVSGVDGPETFSDYSDHPFAHGRPAKLIRRTPPLFSTASGRYQVLLRFWRAYQQMLQLTDFSPESQDKVALRQIKEKGAISFILSGDITKAIELCSNIWASLPGNSYGQGGHSLQVLLDKWKTL